jgi:hypothetical protein
MMPDDVTEQQLLDALHRVPRERWKMALACLMALEEQPGDRDVRPIRTAADLLQSGLIGIGADRTDITDSREFVRRLRDETEHRRSRRDAGGQ